MAWYPNGMKTTIDKAGRVVIPARIREKAGLKAGTELEVSLEDTGVRIARAVPGPKLVRSGRRLLARPTAPTSDRSEIDIAALIEEERDRWL